MNLQMDIPSYSGVASKKKLSCRRHALLLILFLIVCWAFSAVCLINLRRNERSIEDSLERKAIVAVQLNRA